MVARIVAIRTTEVWNSSHITLRPGPFSCRDEDGVDVLVITEDNEFLMDPDNVRPIQAAVQLMQELILQMLEETTLECRLGSMMEIKVVSLLIKANQETSNKKTPLFTKTWKKS